MDHADSTPDYDDGLVRLDAAGIRLARYYFPFGGARRIAWTELRGYEIRPMTGWSGRHRAWGSHRLDWWFQLDVRRHRKHHMVVLDVTGTKPVITPADVKAVCAILGQHVPGRGSTA